jgi:hypothetical protein
VDNRTIEQRLLDLAYTTDAKLTATALAYFAPCSIEDAARVLDDLAAKGRLTMDVQDDGSIVYELLGRQKLAPAVRPLRPEIVRAPGRAAHAPSPMVAALLTVLIPGAGHLYARHVFGAVMWFMLVSIGYVLVLPGLVLHMWSIISAAAAAQRLGTSTSLRALPA